MKSQAPFAQTGVALAGAAHAVSVDGYEQLPPEQVPGTE
jgi:hypothetical protein